MSLEWVLGAVVVVLSAALLALGGQLMAAPSDFSGARWAFSGAFFLLLLAVILSLFIFSPEDRLKHWRILLAMYFVLFGLVGVGWTGTFLWIQSRQTKAEDKERRLAVHQDKIKVYLSNADSFGYRNATKNDYWKTIIPTEPIELTFQRERAFTFSFGVANENAVGLEDVDLSVFFRPEDHLTISNDGTDDKSWKAQRTNEHYWYRFKSINPHDEKHNWHPLLITFLVPRDYIFRFEIKEKHISPFTVEVPVRVKRQQVPDTPHSLIPGAL